MRPDVAPRVADPLGGDGRHLDADEGEEGDVGRDGPVSFEADHFDLELGQGWSVLVRGDAHRVLQPGELRNLREGCDLRPWPAGEHDLFVRIIPGQLTGRRIRSQ